MQQQRMSYSDLNYPAGRPQFFALHYLRRLLHEGMVSVMPPAGLPLMLAVAMKEDDERYRRPATFFNDQLTSQIGCSEDTLDRTRRTLMGLGLLRYERGSDRRKGTYWVLELTHWENCIRTSADASADASADPLTLIQPKKPHTLSPPNTAEGGWASGLDEIVEELKSLGVRRPVEAARTGLNTLATGDEPREHAVQRLRDHVSHFRSLRGAWGPVVLYYRLLSPELRHWQPTDGWPPPLAAYASAQQRTTSSTAADEARARTARLRQLELDFDPVLKDFANIGEVIARYQVPDRIAARLRPYIAQRWTRSLRASDETKLLLLEHLNGGEN